jgi:hypothetical protein
VENIASTQSCLEDWPPVERFFFFIRDRFAFEKCEDGRSYCLVVCTYFVEFTLRRKFLPKFAPTTTTLDIGTIAQKHSLDMVMCQ